MTSLLAGKSKLEYLNLRYDNSETIRHQNDGGYVRMCLKEHLELSELYSPALFSQVNERIRKYNIEEDPTALAVTSEILSESYDELTTALLACQSL